MGQLVYHYGVGVEAEGFASPLNCRWLRYCSAFPDTDAPFGSLGSFFGFRPNEVGGCTS
jgi:phosphorylated CTD-interacting factor 1